MDINNLNSVNNRVIISDRQIINESLGNALKAEATENSAKSAMTIIKSLANGDVFNAEVTDIKGNAIALMLENGKSLTANLLNELNINIGDNLSFMVQDNTRGSILLKALEGKGTITDNTMIMQSLENAGFPDTEKNREMVLQLMRNNLPINKETLVNLSRTMNAHPNSDIQDVITLMRLGIDVNEESLRSYSNYKEYNSAMLSDATAISDAIKASTTSGKELMEIADIFSDENGSVAMQGGQNNIAVLREGLINEVEVLFRNNNLTIKLPDNMQNMSDSQFMSALGQLLTDLETKAGMEASAKSIYSSPNFERLMDVMVRNSFAMQAGDISKPDAVKENMIKAVEKIDKLIAYSEESGNRLINDSANSMRNNMEFLNNLNQFVASAQIPLKNLGDGGEGELYVYRRSSKKNEAEDDVLKAYLHLDMQHLGSLDIYVTLNGKNASTNFCVEDEAVLDFLEENMHLLTEKLSEKGYSLSTKLVSGDEEAGFDFVKEVIAPNLPVNEIKRFRFDVKA